MTGIEAIGVWIVCIMVATVLATMAANAIHPPRCLRCNLSVKDWDLPCTDGIVEHEEGEL